MSGRRRNGSGGGGGAGFRRRGALHGWTLHFGPNMTPMVDVVMVILIFFMALAAFGGREWFLAAGLPNIGGVGARPPKAQDPNKLPAPRLDLVLERDPSGRTVVTFLELKRGSVDEFVQLVARFRSDSSTSDLEVIVKPTSDVPYPDVIRVHEACKSVGIWKVGLGARAGG